MPYQVLNWDAHFENNKSRERDRCGFVCVPNKQDGLGLAHILSETDGAAIYGIFQLVLGALSRQHRPRAGWLTADGHPAGAPWAPSDLALRWRRTESEVSRALEVLCSERVGWMAGTDCPTSARAVPVRCPGMEGNGREGKGREEKECAEPAAPPPALTGLPLYENDQKLCRRWSELAQAWEKANPGVDVLAEVRKAHAWEVSNPSKRKRDRARFLGAWIARAQDRGRPAASNVQGRRGFEDFPDWMYQGPVVGPDGKVVPDAG